LPTTFVGFYLSAMVIKRTDPRYPRQGPSCLLVIFVLFGIIVGLFVISNSEEVRDVIIPTPTPEPTRSATEFALLATLSEEDGEYMAAIEYYENAVRLDATKPQFFIDLITLLVKTGQPERALEVAEQAIILAPESDAVMTAVAAAHRANGDRLYDLGDPTGAELQ
jgi:tetratricopeptide (TPR) repeat protein